MPTYTETTTINSALRLIKGTTVTSRTDGTPNGDIANDLYDQAVEDLLGSHPWNFATQRAQLVENDVAPTFGFDNAFNVPAGWVRTISVHDNDAGVGTIDYREEAGGDSGDTRVIVTDVEEVYMRYVAANTNTLNPNFWPPTFRQAVITALARDFCIPVANSRTMRDEFAKDAVSALLEAKAEDAKGSFPEPRPAGSWITSRGGWGGSSFKT